MSLYRISEHTVQINAWIGLCQLDDAQYPNDLRKRGYIVDRIDPKFPHNDNELNPPTGIGAPTRNQGELFRSYTPTRFQPVNTALEGTQKPSPSTLQSVVPDSCFLRRRNTPCGL